MESKTQQQQKLRKTMKWNRKQYKNFQSVVLRIFKKYIVQKKRWKRVYNKNKHIRRLNLPEKEEFLTLRGCRGWRRRRPGLRPEIARAAKDAQKKKKQVFVLK